MERRTRFRVERRVLCVIVLSLALTLAACRETLWVDVQGTPVPRLRQESALGRVAYVQGGNIWIKELPDGQPRRLTEGGDSTMPRWSPFGEWLLFQKGAELWLVRADGGEAQRLLAASNPDRAAWSPTGNRFTYLTSEGNLVLFDAGAKTEVLLFAGLAGPDAPRVEQFAWNPNGKWIACQVAVGATGDQGTAPLPVRRSLCIWQVDEEPSGPHGCTDLLVEDRPMETTIQLAGWSGEGTHILYWKGPASTSTQADGMELFSLSTRSGSPHTLAASMLPRQDFIALARWRLALAVGDGRESWYRKQLVAIDADGESPISLSAPDQAAILPAWSPDDQRVAYTALPSAQDMAESMEGNKVLDRRRIWVVAADGQERWQLTDDPSYRDERPLWSADGEHILFARITEGQASLWLMRSEGSELRQVVEELSPALDWFGYYGYVEWERLFDYCSGPVRFPELPILLPASTSTLSTDTPE